MKRILLATLATLSINANATDLSDFYFSVGVGAVFPTQDSSSTADSTSVLYPSSVGTSLFTLPNVHWENDYDTGLEASTAIGMYVLKNWRIEGEFLYQNMDRDIGGEYDWQEVNASTRALFDYQADNSLSNTTSTVNIYSLMANTLYDFKNKSKWTPSVGAGVGIAWIDSDETTAYNTLHVSTNLPPLDELSPTLETTPSLYGTAFAWQLKLGLDYELQKHMLIGLNYRLFGTTDFKNSHSTIVSNPDIDGEKATFRIHEEDIEGMLNNSVYVSWKYQF